MGLSKLIMYHIACRNISVRSHRHEVRVTRVSELFYLLSAPTGNNDRQGFENGNIDVLEIRGMTQGRGKIIDLYCFVKVCRVNPEKSI